MRVANRPPSPHNTPPNTGSQYFDRRGEVNDLRQALRSGIAERDTEKLKDSIKKVIGYMTLGIDMSRLFSEMVMASQLGDLVQKKLVYLYITAYAEENSDLAILAINTLQKDIKDVDPSVRGLALRSLCSLHLPNGWEYFQPALSQGLSDPSGYVRKTAVMSLLKMKDYSEIDQFIPQILRLLSSDADANVVANCVAVLAEFHQLPSDKLSVYRLLNLFPSFSEYGKYLVMDKLLTRYFPESDDEMFDLMNILDIHLRQTSVSVSIQIMRLFRAWTSTCQSADLSTQVLLRCKDPLLTLLSSASSSPELQYAVLGEILIVMDADETNAFTESIAPHYRMFLLTDSDQCHALQKLKIDVLARIATVSNFAECVAAELGQSIGSPVAQHAVDALVQIASTCPSLLSFVSESLLSRLENPLNPTVTSACILGIRNLVSLFPSAVSSDRLADLIEPTIASLAGNSDEGLAACISLLGDLGFDSSDLLDSVVSSLWENSTQSSSCRSAAISTCVKIFFQHPSREAKKLLERVLYLAIEETTDPDVRDTALFYYRMIKLIDAKELRTFFSGTTPSPAVLAPPTLSVVETGSSDDLIAVNVQQPKKKDDESLISF